MRYAIIEDGAAREIHVGQSFTAWVGGQAYTVCREWLTLPAEDLATFGVKTVVSAAAPPDGQRVAATTLSVNRGKVVEVATYEDQPEPPAAPRRLIAKSVIIRRLHEAGLLAAAMDVLDQPENLYARERWRAPDWPNVYADDPELVGVLTQIAAEIGQVTAA